MEGSSTGKLYRDNTIGAHAHQFKKVLELSDVIIQVRITITLCSVEMVLINFAQRCSTPEIQWDAEVRLWKRRLNEQAETK